MSILIKGYVVDYTITESPLTRTPAESYSAWATDLGVSSTASLYALDGDDTAIPIDFAAPPVAGGITRGFLSTEGGLGWYLSGVPGSPVSALPEGVTRFFQLTPLPDWLLVFHPDVDCKSAAIKLQKSGATTIITGEIRSLSGSSQITEFSARFDGASGWQLDIRVVAGTLPLAFFTEQSQWLNRPASGKVRFSLSTMTIGQSRTFTGAASPGSQIMTMAPNVLVGVALPLVSQPLPTTGLKLPSLPLSLHSIWHSGTGRISGTVKEAGTPDHAVKRRVRLHRKIDGMMLFETWSKPDGTYLFENLMIQPYYVVAFDHTGNYNGVIKDSIIPELMP